MSDTTRKTWLNLQEVTDAVTKFGGYSGKAAAILQASPAEVALAAAEAHKAGVKPSEDALEEKRIRNDRVVPKLKYGGFSREELIEEIKRIADDHDGRMSARLFGEMSQIPIEYLYGIFGNFAEATKQAGLRETTAEARTRTALARIAAAEQIKPHIEKLRIAGAAYDRWASVKTREIHMLVISDTHDLWMDPLVKRAFLEEAASGQYHHIILNGDIYDMYEVSRYPTSPQWVMFKAARDFNRQFLTELREAAPDAQIDLIEGNHEFRLIKKCIEIPAMGETLGLTGFDLPRLLGFDALEINYVGVKDLSLPEKQKWMSTNEAPQGKVYYKAFLATHLPNFYKKAGMPGTHGHTHKFQAIPSWSATHGNHHWWVTGAGCIRKAEYARGGTMLWNSGFMTVVINRAKDPAYVKAQWHQADMDIRVNGKTYYRTEEEQVGSDDVVEYNRRIVRP